ncbi:hypothetical protein ACI3L1_01370 [Deinococcus sp. SM5_A1]|uniref:hypothetical protein n=1 Tax=Deinococcus sp. SM5_A1 TaxID=3379094 RepID=UPI00385F95A0
MNVADGKFLGYEELDLYSDLTEKALVGEFGDFTSPDKTEYLVKKGHFKLTNFGIQFIFTVIFPVDGKFSKMYPDSPSNSE